MLDSEPDLATSVVYLDIWTALHWAVASDEDGALALAEKILKSGVSPDLNVNGSGRTPLMAAAFSNYKNSDSQKAVKLLLDYGADINARDIKGATVLHEVISDNVCEPEGIKFLLDNGADPNVPDSALNTALHQAYGVMYATQNMLDLSRQVSEKEDTEWVALPPKARQRKEKGRARRQEDILSKIRKLEEIIELLTSYGADVKVKNSFGRTPAECLKDGFGRNEDESFTIVARHSSARDFYRPIQSIGIALADIAKGWFTHFVSKFKCQRLPAGAGLAAYLKLVPRKYMLPPVSADLLNELEEMLQGNLPPQVAELYHDHGGFSESIEGLPYRLLTPDEVMEELCNFIDSDYGFLKAFNDGRKTCIFWQNQWLDYAGVFIDGPLKGKVFLTSDESYPCPNFHDVASFYRWQLMTGGESSRNYDYPFKDAASEIESDVEISGQLLKQWVDGGRKDKPLAISALVLSGSHDGEIWAEELSSIIDLCPVDDTWDVEEAICSFAGGRKWPEAVRALIKEVESDRRIGAAVEALKAIGTQEALDALEVFRKTHGDDFVK